MSTNEFIIGLGGVGGRCISAFRRACILHAKDVNFIKSKGAEFTYLYIDSNDDILNDASWNIFGQSVQLNPNEIIQLKQSGAMPPISEISEYPDIAPWIGNLAKHYAKRKGISCDDHELLDRELQCLKGAGQLRRYGRALYALHADKVRLAIQEKISRLTTGRSRKINFRIFCTLGGGTGSGSVIDVITLIKTLCDEDHFESDIRVYPFIAGNAASGSDSGSFYENEYCTLRDLNALAIGSFHPYMVGHPASDDRDNYFKANEPIQNIYLSTELTTGNPDLKAQVEAMANACLDSIVYSYSYGDANCLRAISGEDLVQVSPGEPTGNAKRSYRFAALGARRWCIPSAQIKELLKLDTEKHILKAFLHGSKLPSGMKRNREAMNGVSFIFENSELFKAYEKIEQDVLKPLDDEAASIQSQNKRDPKVLEKLTEICEAAVKQAKTLIQDQKIRLAISPYYSTDISRLMDNLVENADNAINWNNPDVWGLEDVKAFLAHYGAAMSGWANMGESNLEANKGQDEKVINNMSIREKEWKKLGPLSISLTNLDERLIEWHVEDARQRIKLAMAPFKQNIIKELGDKAKRQISTLSLKVDAAISDIKSRLSEVEQSISKYESELQGSNAADSNLKDLFEYDADNLKKVRQAMEENQDSAYKEEFAKRYSETWEKEIGSLDSYSSDKFKNLRIKLDTGAYYPIMKEVHDAACSQENLKSVLIGSIFERLLQIGGKQKDFWEQSLSAKVRSFMSGLSMSTTLSGQNGLTQPQRSPAAAIAIGLPANKVDANLADWLKEKLKVSRPTAYTVLPGRVDFFEHQSDDEIRVLYMPYWFPARFSPVVDVVYKKYRDTAQAPDKGSLTYFANIDDEDIGLDSKTRPALTKEGDINKENASKVDLATKLFFPFGNDQKAIIRINELGISFLKEVEDSGYATYTQAYANTMRTIPTAPFRSDLARVLRMATEGLPEKGQPGMPYEARKEILDQYSARVEELKNSPFEQKEAEDERALVKEILKL